jgi:hypothetical protein
MKHLYRDLVWCIDVGDRGKKLTALVKKTCRIFVDYEGETQPTMANQVAGSVKYTNFRILLRAHQGHIRHHLVILAVSSHCACQDNHHGA